MTEKIHNPGGSTDDSVAAYAERKEVTGAPRKMPADGPVRPDTGGSTTGDKSQSEEAGP
jgi:hypothetical protein